MKFIVTDFTNTHTQRKTTNVWWSFHPLDTVVAGTNINHAPIIKNETERLSVLY